MSKQRTHYPAKITLPVVGHELKRERLYAQLDNLIDNHPLVWISAPGGAGKTTLCAGYVHDRERNTLWYQCDAGDNDLVTFFHYLTLAAKRLAPRRKKQLPPLTPEYLADFDNFQRQAFAGVTERLKEGGVMVVDNLHTVDESVFMLGLPILVDSMLPSQSLVILSRHQPPAALSAFEARRQMAHVTWQDLRFTEDEWMALPEYLGQRDWDEAQLHRLYQRTDGWVAGLVLSLNSRDEMLDADKDPSSKTFDYFASEYFDHLAAADQNHLLHLAYLPQADATAVEALTGVHTSINLLRRLVRENRFVSRQGDYFTFHPLFHEFLKNRATQHFELQEGQRIMGQSAQHLARMDSLGEAVLLWQQLKQWDAIIEQLLQQAPALYASGRTGTIQKVLDVLPSDHTDANAWLLYWQGVIRCMEDLPSALQSLARSLDLFLADDDANGMILSWFAAVQVMCVSWNETLALPHWLDRFEQQIHPHLEKQSALPQERVVALLTLAYLFTCHDPQRQAYWNSELDRHLIHFSHKELHLEMLSSALFIGFVRGDVHRGQDYYEQLKKFNPGTEFSPMLRMQTLHNLIFGEHFAGSSHKALELAQEALQLSHQYALAVLDSAIHIGAFQAALALGDMAQAHAHLEGLLAYKGGHTVNKANTLFARTALALVEKRYGEAMTFSRQLIDVAQHVGIPLFELLGQIFLAETSLYADLPDVDEQLAQAQQLAGRIAPDTVHQIKIQFLQAEAKRRAGDPEQFREWLKAAWKNARERGLAQFAGWQSRTISRACHSALEQNIETRFVTSFVIRYRDMLQPPADLNPHWPWLVRIHLLGDFKVEVDSEAVSGRDLQVRRLLKLLAAYPKGVDTQYALEFLYSNKNTQHQNSALRKVLQRLRSLLGDDNTVQRDGEYLRLNRKLCWVDADAFNRLLGQKSAQARQQAVTLYRGEFLAHEALDDIDLTGRREILRGAFQRVVLEQLDELDDAQGIELCHQSLDKEPLSEVIYQRLIRIYQNIGRADLALASYEQCRRLMQNELGTEPTQMTRRMVFQE